jgi:uncharacterized protein (DUF1499 family)
MHRGHQRGVSRPCATSRFSTIVAPNAGVGRIETSQQSRWFRFTDDIAIRVVGDEAGSCIDMRSTSRQGRSDYGVNAARIRAYMDALRKRIG